MADRKRSRLLLYLGISLVLLLAAAAAVYADNLLLNGGFEGGFHVQPGINGVVPNNWTAVDEIGNPTYFNNTLEMIEGGHSLYVESQDIETPPNPGKPFKLDVYQTVPVVSGTTYALSGLMVTFCGGTAAYPSPPCPSTYYIGKSAGLDPTGGSDPTGTAVVWSPEDRRDAREAKWVELDSTAVARSPSMTVFLRMNWPFQFHGALGFMDGFQLSPAPLVSMSPHVPVQSAAGISIAWSGWMDPALRNDGDYRLFYDVQARDVTTTTWTTPAADVEGLNGWTFTGQAGHTYAFRARAVAHQPQMDNCTTCAGVNHFFVGLYADPITVTVADNTPPSSAVSPLPAIEPSPAFAVSWSGADNLSAPSALRYDIQVRDGANGAWTDWLTGTAATSATFDGQAGHTYAFRSRARDEAGNLEPVHAGADASTTVALATITGTVRNLREQPQPFVLPSSSPFAMSNFSDLNGGYTVYVTASNTYSLSFARSGYGVLPPEADVVNGSSLGGADAVLPPAVNLVANGQFEAGNLSGWTAAGLTAPAVTATAHSGGGGALLSASGAGLDTSLQQTLFLSRTLAAPTLSYFYRVSSGSSAPFSVSVSASGLLSGTTPSIAAGVWQHRWLDLTPFAGQTITLTFALQPNGVPSSVALDEVEIGSADSVNVTRTYFPVISR